LDISSIGDSILALIRSAGYAGIALGMFFESSFVPVPSELVLLTAGMTGLNLFGLSIAAAAGSTMGSIIGWSIGYFGGRPAIERWGRYIFVTEERVRRAEAWFERWGIWAVLLCRIIPVVPFKVFSITAGTVRFDLKKFLPLTFIGSIPRAMLLATIGRLLLDVRVEVVAALVFVLILGALYWKVRRRG